MSFINEKNIPKTIIYSFLIIMSLMVFMISFFYVKNTYTNFEDSMQEFIKEYNEQQQIKLKSEVNNIIDIIKYNLIKDTSYTSIKEQKRDAVRLLNNIPYQKNNSNYFFVYEIHNFKGGDNFAQMKVNPNRNDLVNRFLSTDYVDAGGTKFRLKFLKDINKKGDSYTKYFYKKPGTNQSREKISYFKVLPEWNWVIGAGIYFDEVNQVIKEKREVLENEIREQIINNIILFISFLFIALLILVLIVKEIENVLNNYRFQVRENAELLELRVQEELAKNREKEQYLIQKSKFISLGEMISNIAHQWRQPLSELSSILMNIKFKHSLDKLDDETMNKKSKEAKEVIQFMSQTIDDFRNFFQPNKSKEDFNLLETTETVHNILSSTLTNSRIEISFSIDQNINIHSYLNEFQQVILNIIKNAKDQLLEKEIEKPWINIFTSFDDNGILSLSIEDNAGGIPEDIIDKIFEPYFSTKLEGDGTGIGLYMSKTIIEKNMKGILSVKNTDNGACFNISFPKESII